MSAGACRGQKRESDTLELESQNTEVGEAPIRAPGTRLGSSAIALPALNAGPDAGISKVTIGKCKANRGAFIK